MTSTERKEAVSPTAADVVGGAWTMELEHTIGFAGASRGTLWTHPNGRDYVCAAGACVVLGDLDDSQRQHLLRGHDGRITSLAVSPSGKLIASGQGGKRPDVMVWSFKKRKRLLHFAEHYRPVICVAFSDDERFLATVDEGDRAKMIVWDLHTGMIVGTQRMRLTVAVRWGGRVRDVKGRPTTNYLMASVDDEGVKSWSFDVSTGEFTPHLLPVGPRSRTYTALEFSDDGTRLFAGSETGDVSVFRFAKGKAAFLTAFQCCSGGVQSLAIAPTEIPDDPDLEDTMTIHVGGGDGTISTFRCDDNKSYVDINRRSIEGGVTSLTLSKDCVELLAGTNAGDIVRVRCQDLKPVKIAESHCSAISAVYFPPKVSDQFLTVGRDGDMRVWDGNTYTVAFRGTCASVPTSACVSRDCLIVGCEDGNVRAFDRNTAQSLWSIDSADPRSVTTIALSKNQKFVVTGGETGNVRVWELRSRQLISNLKQHKQRITGLAMYDDNGHVVSSSRDRSFVCWDLLKELSLSTHKQRMGALNAVALSSDQKFVLTGGQEQSLTVWDLHEPQPVRIIQPAHAGEITCIAAAPNNPKVVITGGTDQSIKLWDISTGDCLASGHGHAGSVTDIKFSPDGRQIASVGEDGCIFVWNLFAI